VHLSVPHHSTLQLPLCLLFFRHSPTAHTSTLSLHDALPICRERRFRDPIALPAEPDGGRERRRLRALRASLPTSSGARRRKLGRSEEHTSELQSLTNLVCRLLLEKKNRYGSTCTHVSYPGTY